MPVEKRLQMVIGLRLQYLSKSAKVREEMVSRLAPPTPPPPTPPPPPANVPDLPEKVGGKPATVRERMALHSVDPGCKSCHVKMDPLGFSLDNYDAIGKWRAMGDGGLA